MDSDRKLVLMLWTVVAVLVAGVLAGGIIFMHKDDELTRQNAALSADNSRLISQVKQARSSQPTWPRHTPTPTPTP